MLLENINFADCILFRLQDSCYIDIGNKKRCSRVYQDGQKACETCETNNEAQYGSDYLLEYKEDI